MALFVGLILLAILLLASGIVLLLGLENIRDRFASTEKDVADGDLSAAPASSQRARASANGATSSEDIELDELGRPLPVETSKKAALQRSSMRPYRIAKTHNPSHNDQMIGLLLVLGGLAMLYVVPAFIFSGSSSSKDSAAPPRYESPDWERERDNRDTRSGSSNTGQGVLGMLTLVILVISFAMLKPDKGSKTEKVGLEKAKRVGKAVDEGRNDL